MTGRDGGYADLRGDMQGHSTQLGLNQKWGEHETFKNVYISNCKELMLFVYSFIHSWYLFMSITGLFWGLGLHSEKKSQTISCPCEAPSLMGEQAINNKHVHYLAH